MTGTYNKTWPKQFLHSPNILSHLIHRSVDKEVLCVDSPDERNFPLEFGRKCFSIHMNGLCLQRVQGIHTEVNQIRDYFLDGTAGMQNHL